MFEILQFVALFALFAVASAQNYPMGNWMGNNYYGNWMGNTYGGYYGYPSRYYEFRQFNRPDGYQGYDESRGYDQYRGFDQYRGYRGYNGYPMMGPMSEQYRYKKSAEADPEAWNMYYGPGYYNPMNNGYYNMYYNGWNNRFYGHGFNYGRGFYWE